MAKSWLETILFGIRYVYDDGLILTERPALNFVGATVSEDPVNNWITIEIPATDDLLSATHLALPDTIVKRDASAQANFAGTCNFETVNAAVSLTTPLAQATACEADTIEATTIVASPLYESPLDGVWRSADQTAAATNSGATMFSSGEVGGAGSISGNTLVTTGDALAASCISGSMLVKTGDATLGSGTIAIVTGTSDGAISAGQVAIVGGDALGTGRGASVGIWAGGSSSGSELGGDITLTPGVGAGGDGKLLVSGVAEVSGRSTYRTDQDGGWFDILGPYVSRGSGATIPVLTTVGASVVQKPLWQIDDLAYWSWHIPHAYKLETDVYFHIHWLVDNTDVNTVKWQISFYYAKKGDPFSFGGTGTIITVEQAASGVPYEHMIAESVAVTIPSLEPDGFVVAEVKRITNGGTDNTGNVFAWEADIHAQSIEQTTKERNGPWGT